MLKNILNLENVKNIDKKEQKLIKASGIYNFNLPIGIYCGFGDSYCCSYCNKRGYDGGYYYDNGCSCRNK